MMALLFDVSIIIWLSALFMLAFSVLAERLLTFPCGGLSARLGSFVSVNSLETTAPDELLFCLGPWLLMTVLFLLLFLLKFTPRGNLIVALTVTLAVSRVVAGEKTKNEVLLLDVVHHEGWVLA